MTPVFKVVSDCSENIFLSKATTCLSIYDKVAGITNLTVIISPLNT